METITTYYNVIPNKKVLIIPIEVPNAPTGERNYIAYFWENYDIAYESIFPLASNELKG